MVELLFMGAMLYCLVMSVIQLVLNPKHAKASGSRRWASRIPNYAILVVCSLLLFLYPFTNAPYVYARLLSVSVIDQYMFLLMSAFGFHMVTIFLTKMRRNIKNGEPFSFVAHYMRIFFTKTTDHRDGADMLLAHEYSVIGTFGGLAGSIYFSGIIDVNPLVVFLMGGVLLSVIYLFLAKLFSAEYY